MTWPHGPFLARATDADRLPSDPAYLLGVVHRDCGERAVKRLVAGELDLAEDLPVISLETDFVWSADEEPGLHLPARPDRCLFCGTSADLTREHIWPDWFIRGVSRHGTTVTVIGQTKQLRDVTVNACGECNHKWMSVLENDAREVLLPMLKTQRTDIDQIQCRTLATWAVMKAYEIDSYADNVVPSGYLHDLRIRKIPPHGTQVWIGGYTPDGPGHAWITYHRFPGLAPGVLHPPVNGFVVTFTVFQVLFQVAGHFVRGAALLTGYEGQVDEALVELDPNRHDIRTWPPATGFDPESFHLVAQRFANQVGDDEQLNLSPHGRRRRSGGGGNP